MYSKFDGIHLLTVAHLNVWTFRHWIGYKHLYTNKVFSTSKERKVSNMPNISGLLSLIIPEMGAASSSILTPPVAASP